MRQNSRYIPDPGKYRGRFVNTTDGKTGVVKMAFVEGGLVRLYCLDVTGHDGLFHTDTEHATLVSRQPTLEDPCPYLAARAAHDQTQCERCA